MCTVPNYSAFLRIKIKCSENTVPSTATELQLNFVGPLIGRFSINTLESFWRFSAT